MAASNWYGSGVSNLIAGNYAWNNDYNITCALLNGQYIPDEENDQLFEDIESYEIEGTGYTRVTLDVTAPTYYPVLKEIWLPATNDIEYLNATFSARYIAIFVDSGTEETSYLIGWIDFGENKIVEASTFSFIWNENGIFRMRKG